MALSKSSATYNKQNWEDSDFPILCQTCLGDNPYVRMVKDRFGSECKICNRPFTTYRWCPGARMRFKKTEVCQTCSRLKNVCQTCLLDLEYGLPVAVRDKALRNAPDLPTSNVNREYYQQQIEKKWELDGDKTSAHGEAGKWQPPSDMLAKLARSAPYYRRNAPHVCSFWVKGECKRGELCPYRHEKPTDPDDPLSDQNLKDRFYGTNDPVAEKLMRKYDETASRLEPPADPTVSTLYVGGISQAELVTETDLRNTFYQFGEIRSVHVAAASRCAFVEFARRTDAERAANALHDRIVINGQRLVLRWARGSGQREEDAPLSAVPVPGLPAVLPAPPFPVNPAPHPYPAEAYSNSAVAPPDPSQWHYAASRPGPSGFQSSYASAASSSRPGPSTHRDPGPSRDDHHSAPHGYGPSHPKGPDRHAKSYYPSQDPNRMGGAPGGSSRSRYGK